MNPSDSHTHATHKMQILVISNRDPLLDMLHVVEDSFLSLIIVIGDVTREDLLMLGFIKSVPILGIYGETDDHTYFDSLGIIDISDKVYDCNGVKIGGISQDTQRRSESHVQSILDGFGAVDLLVSHDGAIGVADETEGYRSLKSYIDTNKPGLFLYGHNGVTVGNTSVDYNTTHVHHVDGSQVVSL